MIEDNELIQVQNLADHAVVYISYDGKRRKFNKNQIMKVPAGELRQLIYTHGGEVLIKDYLSIKNRALAEELGVDMDSFDNEYNWTQDDVDNVLNEEDIDVLADALDFAPKGIIDMIIARAIDLNLRDFQKRELIKKATGKDITALISIKKQAETIGTNSEKEETKTRRRAAKKEAPEEEEKPARRSSGRKKATETTNNESVEEHSAEE